MSVQELGVLHQRYVELSDRFRSAWAFHKFLGSLTKVLMNSDRRARPLDFQTPYTELKEISHHLNASDVDLVREKLDKIEANLGELSQELLAEDSRVAPADVRHFFRRVKNPDAKVLTQLAKFLLGAYPDHWNDDRLDKFDFLVTHLAAESDLGGGGTTGSREQFRQVLDGLFNLVGDVRTDPAQLEEHRLEIKELQGEISLVEDLDEVHERRLVKRYREAKRRMGPRFFEPGLLLSIVGTNLALGETIAELYRKEERRIAADCREVFTLEQGTDIEAGLDLDLSRFRREFERFEKELRGGELKLDRLAEIRTQARSLTPRLRGQQGEGGERDADTAEVELGHGPRGMAAAGHDPLGHLIGYADPRNSPALRRILDALAGANPEASPAEVAVHPEVFPLRLEAREVLAYRQLTDVAPDADLEMERFLLEAASLRVRLNEGAEEIRSILDDTAATGEGPTFDRARKDAVRADSYLRHFGHLIENAVLEGREHDARELQLLRMRLMRDYSGLWLLAFRPSRLATRPELARIEAQAGQSD